MATWETLDKASEVPSSPNDSMIIWSCDSMMENELFQQSEIFSYPIVIFLAIITAAFHYCTIAKKVLTWSFFNWLERNTELYMYVLVLRTYSFVFIANMAISSSSQEISFSQNHFLLSGICCSVQTQIFYKRRFFLNIKLVIIYGIQISVDVY